MEHDDATLVRQSRAGDPEAFGLLVRRHLKAAHGVAHAVLRNPADSDDVVQEAFIEALRRLDDCREPARFRSWLLAIVRSRGLNRRRYLRLRLVMPLDAASEVPGAEHPDRDLERRELGARLDQALSRLGSREREIVLLSDLEGWTHAEIGELLGISEASSRQHLHRARKRLRALLGPNDREEAIS